ncbi:hypothetical protein AB0L75_03640 [Streptomyces sp. NPDC052101]|uniref:hypothetical protein n=1 Tax=Streptomyces sp. NPDC052101 TaxID=3155763 RepID=UPI0034251280
MTLPADELRARARTLIGAPPSGEATDGQLATRSAAVDLALRTSVACLAVSGTPRPGVAALTTAVRGFAAREWGEPAMVIGRPEQAERGFATCNSLQAASTLRAPAPPYAPRSD